MCVPHCALRVPRENFQQNLLHLLFPKIRKSIYSLPSRTSSCFPPAHSRKMWRGHTAKHALISMYHVPFTYIICIITHKLTLSSQSIHTYRTGTYLELLDIGRCKNCVTIYEITLLFNRNEAYLDSRVSSITIN